MATYTAGAFILSGTPGHSATTVTEIVDFNITDNGGLTMLYQPATTTALEDWSDSAPTGTTMTGTVGGSSTTYTMFLEVNYSEVRFLDSHGNDTYVQGYRVALYDSTSTVTYAFFPVRTAEVTYNPTGTHASDVSTGDDQTTAVGSIEVGYTTASMGLSPTDFKMEYNTLFTSIPTTVVCFAQDTHIQTIKGQKRIQDLNVGDLIFTRDNGYQPIRWIGQRSYSAAALQDQSWLRPIIIRAGALGYGIPSLDMTVSPQHRILVNSRIAQRMFGEDGALIAAKKLTWLDGVDEVCPDEGIEYYHILCDAHQIIEANGTASETMLVGPQTTRMLSDIQKDEIRTAVPALAAAFDGGPCAQPARPIISGAVLKSFKERHQKNDAMVVEETGIFQHTAKQQKAQAVGL